MECNKEEAIRAKEIAEEKMQINDFLGAKRVALKAQRLFADLDNISQMICVCEVLCCAGARVNGQMDWYGILQVEHNADESSIKKQYRKLALQLHPDKNKFAGAEAAFKLIGEAHMTLSDRARRYFYDMKRRVKPMAEMPRKPANQPDMTSFAGKQPEVKNNFTDNLTSQQQQKPPPPPFECNNQAFWTMCPNCGVKFKCFPRTLLNKSLRCRCCLKSYTAYEFKEPMPHRWESSAPVQSRNQNSKQEVPSQASKHKEDVGAATKQKEDGVEKGHRSNNSTKMATRKRSRTVKESSERDSSTDSEYEAVVEDAFQNKKHNAETTGGRYPRRSCRMKQNITCNEGGIEDGNDIASPLKRSQKVGTSNNANDDQRNVTFEESLPNGGKSANNEKREMFESEMKSNAVPTVNSKSKSSSNVSSSLSPDSGFYDFKKEKDPTRFEAGQIWAACDSVNAMPRYYARIREVLSPFRLRFTWLENTARKEFEEVWINEELPVACGNYRHGRSEFTEDLQMFSHVISWNKGTKPNTFDIYPRKGEVWALFKGWDGGWSSDADSHRLYEYDVAEVLSDFSHGSGGQIIHLVKVQGFASLFVRAPVNGKFQIPPAEVLRFSHNVPSHRVSKGERKGVPEGSFELDAASLPSNFGETFPSVRLDITSVKEEFTDDKKSMKMDENGMGNTESKNLSPKAANGAACSANPIFYEYPPNDFHNFDEDRLIEKFQLGQIWALYSDVDQHPKFYAKIKKVDVEDGIVSVSWVELCPQRKDEVSWTQRELPATCGRFRVDRVSVATFDTTDTFSHLVCATPIGKRGDQYDIYPQSGEVWALYKGWNKEWTRADFGKCEYHVVKILGVGSLVKVLLLSKVAGYTSVFKPEMTGGDVRMMDIPLNENLRFSHRIPAFQLTNEAGGALEGFLELDSAAVPCI